VWGRLAGLFLVGSLFVFIMLLVCSARDVELGVVSFGGLVVRAKYWLFCVFFVL